MQGIGPGLCGRVDAKMEGEVCSPAEEAGAQVEERVVDDDGLAFVDAQQVGGIAFGEADDGGDRTAFGFFEGVEMPAGIDLSGDGDGDFCAGFCSGWNGLDVPLRGRFGGGIGGCGEEQKCDGAAGR